MLSMTRGAVVPLALLFSLLPGGLLTYLVLADEGGWIIRLALLIVFGLLALRGFGLKRADIEGDPQGGALRLNTEFEDPKDSEG